MWTCGLGWGGWGSAGGNGGVWCWAVLLPMFKPERVTPGWWGGRSLRGIRYWTLWWMLGQLRERHIVQFWGHLRPPESVHIKYGLPLFGLFVDGQLGALNKRSSYYDFRPCASTRLCWWALHPVNSRLRRAAVRQRRGEGEGALVELMPSVAQVWMRLWGSVGNGKRTGVQRSGGKQLVAGVRAAAAV